MALLMPFTASGTFPWGPTTKTAEPAGYAQLGRFWWNRYDSFKFYYHFHPGWDLGAALGTPIHASETGIIAALGLNGVSGLRYNIRIRPGTLYVGGHLNGFAKNPRTGNVWHVGEKILRGEVIGYVGKTGVASGPHLHFGVQCVIPGTTQNMLYDPRLFFPGGANENDPRIKPVY